MFLNVARKQFARMQDFQLNERDSLLICDRRSH